MSGKMKVTFTRLPFGLFVARPVSEKWHQRFLSHMQRWKGADIPEEELTEACFHSAWHLPAPAIKRLDELEAGWEVTVLVDPFEFGNWLGWDAHIVAMRYR
jgi:hypothetical protein